MSERIEWAEPAQATDERRQRSRQAVRDMLAAPACYSIVLSLPAVFVALAVAPEAAFSVGLGVAGIIGLSSIPLSLAPLAFRKQSRVTCVLDRAGAASQSNSLTSFGFSWSQAASFEIADHPTLPGIRTLTIQREGSPHGAQFNFHAGQLDEAELSAFVQARIAEPIAQRLMRRVKM